MGILTGLLGTVEIEGDAEGGAIGTSEKLSIGILGKSLFAFRRRLFLAVREAMSRALADETGGIGFDTRVIRVVVGKGRFVNITITSKIFIVGFETMRGGTIGLSDDFLELCIRHTKFFLSYFGFHGLRAKR